MGEDTAQLSNGKLKGWVVGRSINYPSTESPCKKCGILGLEIKIHVYPMPGTGKKFPQLGGNKDFCRALCRCGTRSSPPGNFIYLISAGLCLSLQSLFEGRYSLRDPVFLRLCSPCQDLLNGYFLDDGFSWIVWLAGVHR